MTESQTSQSTEEPTDARFDARTVLYWAALALFSLLAAVALLQFYWSASRAIDVFVADAYRPLFKAAFHLVVLLPSGIGITWTVRRLTA